MVNAMPQISVIMGVYNCKNVDWLFRAVDSIINQTFKDWELIIVNDGSTELETNKALKMIEKLDIRVKVIGYQENRGLASALNYGIFHSHGKYIARMDDDDISHSNRFEEQIKFLEKHKEFDFVGSIANVFNENGVWGVLKMPRVPNINDFLWNIPFIHPSMIFKKSILLEINGYRTDNVNRRCEDYTLVMDLYHKGYRGYNFQKPLIDYYVENSDKKYRKINDRICEAIVRFRGYKKNGILLKGIPFIIKPLILGLIPQIIFRKIKELQYYVNRR